MALTLLPNYNVNDATSQWFKFGSIEQNSGADLYTGLKVLGTNVASTPLYIVQNAAKITKYWADADIADFQILVKAKAGGALIDAAQTDVYYFAPQKNFAAIISWRKAARFRMRGISAGIAHASSCRHRRAPFDHG